jgi:hypothetical protein
MMVEGERQASVALDVDLRRDVAGALGTEWASYLGAPPGGGLVPDFAVFVAVKDRPRLEAALDRAVARLKGIAAEEGVRLEVADTHFRGTRIRFVELSERDGDPIPVAPSWAFGDDFLLMALCPQTVKHALMEKPALPANEEYRDLLRRIPEGASSITYMDAAGLVTWLYNTAAPLLQVFQGTIHAHAEPFGVKLRLQDLPTADVLRRHLGGWMSYTVVGDDVVRIGYVSDFGASGVVVAAAPVLAGLAVVLIPRGMKEVERARAVQAEAAHAEREVMERHEAERLRAENAMLQEQLAEIERQLEELRRLVAEAEGQDAPGGKGGGG